MIYPLFLFSFREVSRRQHYKPPEDSDTKKIEASQPPSLSSSLMIHIQPKSWLRNYQQNSGSKKRGS